MTRFAQSSFSVGVGSEAYRNNYDEAFGKKPTPKACSGYVRGGDARGPCDKAAQILCDACGHAYCDDHGCACPT